MSNYSPCEFLTAMYFDTTGRISVYMDEAGPFPEGVLEDIAYLSRSANRARILDALSVAASTRRALEEDTDVSRATLDRIVNELEERGWVTRTAEGEYVATPTGERIAMETRAFAGAVAAVRRLGEAVDWLPHRELDLGLEHFRDAVVRQPEPNAVNAPSTAATELIREATEFACLVNTPPSLAFEEAMIDGVQDGRLRTNHVITDSELEVLREDPDRAARWRAYVEAGADLYCHRGAIPCNLLVIDERVLVLDQQPAAAEGIESTNPAVLEWARETVEEYREEAERIDPTAFDRG